MFDETMNHSDLSFDQGGMDSVWRDGFSPHASISFPQLHFDTDMLT